MRRLAVVVAMAMVLVAPAHPAAHEIPTDVTIQAFVRPEGGRLRVLVRAPLAAMRDLDVPTRGPGYLDVARADRMLRDAAMLWLADAIELRENGERLGAPSLAAARVSLPSDRSFSSYEEALAHLTGPPLPETVDLYWEQGLLDVLFEYPIASDGSELSIRPAFDRLGLRVTTALRFLPPGGAVRAFELTGDPGLVRLDPRWHQAALRFVKLGFRHILDGVDHLLFLLCLVIPFRRVGPLVAVVTSFTVAHSVTLLASAFNVTPDALWFPPLIEMLVALSIVYMGLENIVSPQLERRWLVTFGFGLVHGFGFSFALQETLQFAGSHLLTSLFAFNVGVEVGQLAALALLVPALALLFRHVVSERTGTIILSALVVHTALHWTVERGNELRQFRLEMPAFDLLLLAALLRWLMLLLVAAGLLRAVAVLARRQSNPLSSEN